MRAHERLLRYIQFDTASNQDSPTCPSTDGQRALGQAIAEEMLSLGIKDARVDQNGYVYGSIPATDETLPSIGLIAHLDTVDDLPVLPMNARIIENYDGCDVPLGDGTERLSVDAFPYLKKYRGQSLIVTDGKTILGADDKAGVAEIMTACEHILKNPTLKHGKIGIAFTPDEEIGRGADLFDVESFGCDFAYTVDGGELGGIEYENFNAASATVTFRGVNIHPGSAKDKMKNVSLILSEFISLLPPSETPAHTQGYEGFFHVTSIQGTVENAQLKCIIRDHDEDKFTERKQTIKRVTLFLNDRYGAGTVETDITDSYFNMKQTFLGKEFIIERAEGAMKSAGVEPFLEAIRGGTDGARLSFMGLPCPNLSTGGMNYHGRHECIVIESMDKMVDVLVNIVCG